MPAYGKQLLNERRQGRHPLVAHVVYSEDWREGERCDLECGAEPPHPRLCVKPSEFEPWTIDWHAVTGCHVALFDSRGDLTASSKKFYELVGELGRFAGPVCLYRGGMFFAAAHVIAAALVKDLGAWPGWWPVETERKNAERRERWAALWAARHEQRAEAAA